MQYTAVVRWLHVGYEFQLCQWVAATHYTGCMQPGGTTDVP